MQQQQQQQQLEEEEEERRQKNRYNWQEDNCANVVRLNASAACVGHDALRRCFDIFK